MLGVGEGKATTPCPWQVLQVDLFRSASMSNPMTHEIIDKYNTLSIIFQANFHWL
jgi:hypothetical protein